MIPIAEYVKNIDRMRVHKDGDAFFVAFDDFVDLQASPAFFVEDEYNGHIKAVFEKWHGHGNPLVHLTHGERCYLSRKLTDEGSDLLRCVTAICPRCGETFTVLEEDRVGGREQ